jgi:hypothetical protein
VSGKKRHTIDFCCNTSLGIRIRSMRGRNASRNSRERHRLRERREGKGDFGRWRFCVPVSLPSLCQCCSSFRSSRSSLRSCLSSLRSSIISVRHLIVRPVTDFIIVSLEIDSLTYFSSLSYSNSFAYNFRSSFDRSSSGHFFNCFFRIRQVNLFQFFSFFLIRFLFNFRSSFGRPSSGLLFLIYFLKF